MKKKIYNFYFYRTDVLNVVTGFDYYLLIKVIISLSSSSSSWGVLQ
jgi:hypothetical protein